MSKQVLVPDCIFTVPDFLSPEECEQYISHSENIGYKAAPITTASGFAMIPRIRNNTRVMLDDTLRAADLWQRIAPHVADPVMGCSALGVNERLRFYRYDPGEKFDWHFDGSYQRPNGERSLLTLMVYLNEGFEGGETRFNLQAPYGYVKVAPKQGMALCFIHMVQHKGAAVIQGRKYVLRSDIMYSKSEDGSSDFMW